MSKQTKYTIKKTSARQGDKIVINYEIELRDKNLTPAEYNARMRAAVPEILKKLKLNA